MRFDRLFRKLQLRLRSLFRRNQVEQELDEEIQYHVDQQIALNIASGMNQGEARTAARRQFGNTTSLREQTRSAWGWSSLEQLGQDVRYATSVLRKNPGFTLVAVLSLAIGIGANTAIFSVLNAVMLRALPVARPAELFVVRLQSPTPVSQLFSYPLFEKLRDGMPSSPIAAMGRVAQMHAVVDGRQERENANVQLVSGEFFSVFSMPATLGRTLTPDDNRIVGGQPVIVLSHAYWQRRFAGSPDIIGSSITLNGTHFTIIGVAAAGFSGVWLELPTDGWIPMVMQHDIQYSQHYSKANTDDSSKPWLNQDGIRWLDLVCRVRPDSLVSLQNGLNSTFQQTLLKLSETIGDPGTRRLFLQRRLTLVSFESGFSNLRQTFAIPLYALMAMVALVLLIACSNTANLLLARAGARQREIAVRLSIGATRLRLIRQLLTESALIGGLAAILGLIMAQWTGGFLVRTTLGTSTGPIAFSTGIDIHVLAFTAVISVLTVLLFGLVPAIRTTRLELGTSLKIAAGGMPTGSRVSTAKLLVITQVSISLLLVVGAGLFLRSFRNLVGLDLGFERDHVVSLAVEPPESNYSIEELPKVYAQIIDRVETLPGVRSASVAMCGLISDCRSRADGLHISGYQAAPQEQVLVQENRIGLNYFATVGMRILRGRDFDSGDTEKSERVVIVNEAMARRYFNGRDAIGQQFGYEKADMEIVGIVQDARVNSVRESAVPMAFYPAQQWPGIYEDLEVRTGGDPRPLFNELRKAVAAVAPQLPIDRITVLSDQVGRDLSQDRLIAILTSTFGFVGLGLVFLGLYGVMSYAVVRRTSELGVRIALGAPRPQLLLMILRESLLLVSLGLAIGIPLAVVGTRVVSSLLFDVHGFDSTTLIAAVLILTTVGAVSSFVPAWRASRVDPLVSLRHE